MSPGRATMGHEHGKRARLRAPLVIGLLAFAAVACNQVVLRTAAEPALACDAALTAGRLVSSRESGLALRPADGGPNIAVTWPFGYSARGFVGGLELRDEAGRVLAREGDFVQVGGGMGGDDSWIGCAGSISVIPAPG
jgi:hypothetical protein